MSRQPKFVHLHTHSAFSLLEGACHFKDILSLCLRYQMPAVAITDTNNLFGALEFALSAKSEGIQPIIGIKLFLNLSDNKNDFKTVNAPFILLAKSETGYKNLLKLTSHSYLNSEQTDKIMIQFSELERHAEGLICLTGGPTGIIGHYLLQQNLKKAEEFLLSLNKVFENNLYIELMRHDTDACLMTEQHFLKLAYDHQIPLVATNECFFADPSQYEAHDALLCIKDGTYVTETKRRKVTKDHFFKSVKEMQKLFADLPEALENTINIAKKCHFMPDGHKPILPLCPKIKDQTEEEALIQLSEAGLENRLQDLGIDKDNMDERKPYFDRLKFELDVIVNMGFQGYFLIVADFIQWTKNQDIPVGPGRGSGAGSVVAWALSITNLDPLKWGLLFERFLNPERVSMPDFDIDFCQDRRDEVIEYVQSQYGFDRVAQIITFGSLQARAALRDVGRVLQMPYMQVDKICKLIPNNPANPVTLREALEGEPLIRDMMKSDETIQKLIDISLKLEGLYRHASTHAAGVVIGDRPLDELVPLYRDPRSPMPVTQFNMKFVEKAGLVKFDFLGLKTLTVLSETLKILKEKNIDIDLDTISLEDKEVFDLLGTGETIGVFQLESAGMRDVLRKLQPDRFEDITAVNALYRPGPMDNIPKFIACKHGEEEPDYMHPSLESILKETYGIMIYQEQVMEIARVLSGYSLGSADLLRRAMGKKIKEEMEAQRKIFIEGAVENDVEGEKAAQIFDQVNKFAGYGFNKSHAAAYALIAYQTAYLKAKYPAEFFTALMNLDIQNTDKLCVFKQELNRLKIDLLTPDINASEDKFTCIEENGVLKIRYGLAALKGVGSQAMQDVIKVRKKDGPFTSLANFLRRIDAKMVNKKQLEGLICAGALDSLSANRRQLFDSIEAIVKFAQNATSAAKSDQFSLFSNVETPDFINKEMDSLLKKTEDWDVQEKLQKEFQAIGFYLSAHPLDSYKDELESTDIVSSVDIAKTNRDLVKLAGVVVAKKERKSSKGNKYAFLTLSDHMGIYEIMVFSDILNNQRDLIESGEPLIIETNISRGDSEQLRLSANEIMPLNGNFQPKGRSHEINISTLDELMEVSQKIQNCPPGQDKLELSSQFEIDDKRISVTCKPRRTVDFKSYKSL